MSIHFLCSFSFDEMIRSASTVSLLPSTYQVCLAPFNSTVSAVSLTQTFSSWFNLKRSPRATSRPPAFIPLCTCPIFAPAPQPASSERMKVREEKERHINDFNLIAHLSSQS